MLDSSTNQINGAAQTDRQKTQRDQCCEHQVDFNATVGEQHQVAQTL